DQEQADENQHFDQPDQSDLVEHHGPGIKKDDLDVENDKEHREDIIADRERHSRVGKGFAATFVRAEFFRFRIFRLDQVTHEKSHHAEGQRDHDKQKNRKVSRQIIQQKLSAGHRSRSLKTLT